MIEMIALLVRDLVIFYQIKVSMDLKYTAGKSGKDLNVYINLIAAKPSLTLT